MEICKSCGSEIDEGSKFCKNCGAEIIIEKEFNEFKFCSNCGFKMDMNIKFCPECGTSTNTAPQTTVNSQDKNSVLAAILSFLIIGLGQIYLGLTKKGIILFISAVISGFLMLIVIGWITWFIVWVYAIYDAYNSAEKMNKGIAVEDTIDLNNLF